MSSPLLFLFCVIPPTSERARALCLLSLGPLPQPPPENTDHFVFSLFPQKRKIEEGPMDMFFCPAGFLVVVTGANLEQRFSHLLRWVECPTDLLDDPPCPPFPRVITCKHFPQQLGGQGNWVVGVGSITQDTTARERERREKIGWWRRKLMSSMMASLHHLLQLRGQQIPFAKDGSKAGRESLTNNNPSIFFMGPPLPKLYT